MSLKLLKSATSLQRPMHSIPFNFLAFLVKAGKNKDKTSLASLYNQRNLKILKYFCGRVHVLVKFAHTERRRAFCGAITRYNRCRESRLPVNLSYANTHAPARTHASTHTHTHTALNHSDGVSHKTSKRKRVEERRLHVNRLQSSHSITSELSGWRK